MSDAPAISGKIGMYDVDCTHVSNCCGADLRIEGDTTQHYVCTKCGYPCDIREGRRQ